MKAFITGGSGFIASALIKHLLEQGHEVVNLDLKPSSIEHPKLTFIKKSILDDIESDIQGCDVVLHFAAILGVDNSDNHPLDTLKINLEGSVNVFQCALKAGVKDMIYASSSEVYGEPRDLPIKETTTKGPVSTYGVSKLASEMYAGGFNKEQGANIKIVRFFNVYGPGQPVQFVMPLFLEAAKKAEPIRVFGDGSQTRCFTYVEDVARGILTVLEKGETGEAYNIGNNHPTTMLQLAEMVKSVTQSSSEIQVLGFGKETRLKEREINYRIPDISKIQALGWNPTTRVEEGMKKILDSE